MFRFTKSNEQINYEISLKLFNDGQYEEAQEYFNKYPDFKDTKLKLYMISKYINIYSPLNPYTYLNKLHHMPEVQAEIGLYYGNMYENEKAKLWLTRAVENNYKSIEVFVLLAQIIYFNKDTIKMNENYDNLCDYRTRRLNKSYGYFNEAKKLGWVDKKCILLNLYGKQFIDNFYE